MKRLGIVISLLLAVPAVAQDLCATPDDLLEIGCAWDRDPADAPALLVALTSPAVSGQEPLLDCSGFWGPESTPDTYMGAVSGDPATWAGHVVPQRMLCAPNGDPSFSEAFHKRAVDRVGICAGRAHDGRPPAELLRQIAELRQHVERHMRCLPPLSAYQLANLDRWEPRSPESWAAGLDAPAWPIDRDLVNDPTLVALALAAGDPWSFRRSVVMFASYRAELELGNYRAPRGRHLTLLRSWRQRVVPPRPGPDCDRCPPREPCPPPCKPGEPGEPPVSAPVVVFDVKGAQSPTSDRCLKADPPSCAVVPEVTSYDAFELSISMRITLDELPEVGENIAAFYVKGGRQPSDDVLYLILKRIGPNRWKAIGRAGPGKFGSKPKATEKLTKAPEVGEPFLVELDRDADQGVTFRVKKPSGELLAALELGKKAAPGMFRVFVAELGHKGDQVEHGEVPTVGGISARCVGRPEPTVWDQIDRGHGDPTEDDISARAAVGHREDKP
jgi:hypothetical protein